MKNKNINTKEEKQKDKNNRKELQNLFAASKAFQKRLVVRATGGSVWGRTIGYILRLMVWFQLQVLTLFPEWEPDTHEGNAMGW